MYIKNSLHIQKKQIIVLILFIICCINIWGQEAVYHYVHTDKSVIDIKDGLFYYSVPNINGIGYDTLAVCTIQRVNDNIIELNSLEQCNNTLNYMDIAQLPVNAGKQDSLVLQLNIPYHKGPLHIGIFEKGSSITVLEGIYKKNCSTFMLPPNCRNKPLTLFILPEKYFYAEKDGRFFGLLYYDSLFPFIIKDNTGEIKIEIPTIDDLFFDRYNVRGEYIWINNDSIQWKGKVWKVKHSNQ